MKPNYAMNIILSIILGFAAGIGLAYFIEYLDTSVKTVDDVERFLGLPVLAPASWRRLLHPPSGATVRSIHPGARPARPAKP